MPWTLANPPSVAKNWTAGEKKRCVAAANAVLRGGGSDTNAIRACIRAAGKSKQDESIESLIAGPSTLVSQAQLTSKRLKKKIPKPIKPPRTKTLEMSYLRELRVLVSTLIQLTKQLVIPQIEPIVQGANWIRPATDRMDDFSDEIDGVMSTLRVQYFRRVPEKEEAAIAARQANRIERQSSRYFDRLSRQIISVNVARSEPWLTGELHSFVTANTKLIKSLSEQHFSRVEQTITEGVRRGKLGPQIAKEVRGKFRLTKNKAKLIARDQTSKLYGDLNRLRQTNAGVKEYEWETALDERVRPSHASKHGKTFKWSHPPSDTGHPGEDIYCRCVALPIIPD